MLLWLNSTVSHDQQMIIDICLMYLFTDACEQRIENTVETDMPFFPQKEDATSASLCSVILCTYSWFGTK